MTIQLSQIDGAETATLNTPSTNQPSSDNTFEEKLKKEKDRLGLLYSPFAQIPNMFGYLPAGETNFMGNEHLLDRSSRTEETASSYRSTNGSFQSSPANQPLRGEFIDPTQTPRQQTINSLQELLTKTDWLVPNLEASQQFYQAFLAGKLQPNFDLQSLVDQIADQLAVVKTKGKTELSLTLKPPELGNILLTLSYHQGVLSVQIMAQAETKRLIDESRDDLEAALKKAHIEFDRIEIKEVEQHGRNV
ncbi:MAG: flagellar hook-length control protein FliK [Candidatus Margulisbacteria bacterium]|nr:flagellar hook-length control protein FliK [Candidatus Margulisiibacteriota bacterium]MBU1616990.1 flagellar hook-length control protein FliK [Candidatus Margulisiibacteriota bacterium]